MNINHTTIIILLKHSKQLQEVAVNNILEADSLLSDINARLIAEYKALNSFHWMETTLRVKVKPIFSIFTS